MQDQAAGDPPANRRRLARPDAVWDQARRDYLDGDAAETVAARYGVGVSTVRARAKAGGWRRCDQPDPEPVDLDVEEAEGLADYSVMARHALVRLNRAVMAGRAAEAGSWMRLHQRLLDLARLTAEAAAPPPAPDPEEEQDRLFADMTVHLNAVADLARDLARDNLDDPLVREAMMLRLNQTKRAHKHLFPHRADEPLLAEDRDGSDGSDGVFSARAPDGDP